ncbi:DUF3068 domain-containing protein [Nonomuraea sp. NPDC050310]|uniref:DUF3068 domain-containing protein n=1 Tax=unclassified Nonomuraea TaxID=2593643 RepID=UPI0033E5C6E9
MTVVLIGIGAFLIALAALIKFWAADQLIASGVKANQYGVSQLEAKGAQYFSRQDLKVLTADLDIIVTTRGDVKEATGERVVWDEAMVVNDRTNNRRLIDLSERRSAFDKTTGAGINCCGVNVGKEPVQLEGQIYKWPFNVEKTTYKVFNSSVKKALDAKFVREDVVNGLPVYVFEMTVPATKTETMVAPASVFNVEGITGDIQLERWYEGKNTYWIEPVTGSPVRQEQQRHEVLKGVDGVERAKAFVADAKMTDETVKGLVDNAASGKSQINLLTTVIPLSLLGAGIVLLAGGILIGRRRRA